MTEVVGAPFSRRQAPHPPADLVTRRGKVLSTCTVGCRYCSIAQTSSCACPFAWDGGRSQVRCSHAYSRPGDLERSRVPVIVRNSSLSNRDSEGENLQRNPRKLDQVQTWGIQFFFLLRTFKPKRIAKKKKKVKIFLFSSSLKKRFVYTYILLLYRFHV